MLTPDQLRENLECVRARIEAACHRAGRDASDVRLLPITKMHPPEVIGALQDLGLDEIGESRAQELRDKVRWFAERMRPQPTWHFVGPLQRNKVKYVIGAEVRLIHSVDSVALALEIERQAARRGMTVEGLLEVNAGDEASKRGVAPDAAADALRVVRADAAHLRIGGLMTMAPLVEDPEEARPVFRRLRELRDRLQEELDCPLPQLSMGMTNDFDVAVEEGATTVRLGTAILGARREA
jgi:pyridoxal phosphate enzyme (YggS family)